MGSTTNQKHFILVLYSFCDTYSLRPKLWTKCCFMKQKCHLQSGIAQYENVATPFSSKAIHTTH